MVAFNAFNGDWGLWPNVSALVQRGVGTLTALTGTGGPTSHGASGSALWTLGLSCNSSSNCLTATVGQGATTTQGVNWLLILNCLDIGA
jgi:hypothetical protein